MVLRVFIILILLCISVIVALTINSICIHIVSTLLGTEHSIYLWRQFYMMGFIVFYTLYAFLDLVYMINYKS